jgi:hypothetical protein
MPKYLISAFIVPWILKDDERAVGKVKHYDNSRDNSRDKHHHPLGEITKNPATRDVVNLLKRVGIDHHQVFSIDASFTNTLSTNTVSTNTVSTNTVSTNMFTARINKRLAVFARPNALLADGTLIFIDDYWDFVPPAVIKQFETKAMVSMKAWKSHRAIYITSKSNKVFTYDYDKEKWRGLKRIIKAWYKRHKREIS